MLEFLFQRQKNEIDPAKLRIREISVKLSGFDASFLVQQIFKIKKRQNALAGKVLRGRIFSGKTVYLSGFSGTVESMESRGAIIEEAAEGDYIALKLNGLEMPVKRGDILHFK